MTHPTTMLAFIQRFLSAENSSRKRKRNPGYFSSETSSGLASVSSEEINDLRDVIVDHTDSEEQYSSTADRERSITEFLALADTDITQSSAKRRRKEHQGRLSTIEESEEPGQVITNKTVETENDVEMVDVDLGSNVPTGVIYAKANIHDGMAIDQNMWTWKGGNDLRT